MEKRLFTSESVTEGHPDKICDQISDAILDELMRQDQMSRVACETAITTGLVLVMGEITTKGYVDIQKVVRETIREIGYDRAKYGFDCDTCGVITALDEQSADIALGVDKALEAKENKNARISMGKKRAYKSRKSGGGRKKLKPEYDAGKNLKKQMESAVALYDSEMSLQAIGDELGLNPIKVRKLLITAGVYESEVAEKVKNTFEEYRETQDYKTSILSTANTLKLSKASVTSYLPYKKGVYFQSTAEKEKISVGAERQRRYRAMKRWRADPTEENFWGVVLAYAGVKFKTYSGLPFSYQIKKGRNGEYTKELWIDRRENSKSLAWSSVLLALKNIKEEVVERPKALGDIRGVTYIYGMFYRFGLIDVPDEVKEKMGHPKNRKKQVAMYRSVQ